jgi:PAS domain S-box-containing protein
MPMGLPFRLNRWSPHAMWGLGKTPGEGSSVQGTPPLDPGTIFDLLPGYVTVHDTGLRIIRANRAFVRDFGDAIGRPCYEASKGEGSPCPECAMERTLVDGRACSWEESLRTSHMETLHTFAQCTPLRDATGKIVGAVRICSDISELRRVQRQLELSQQEYKALFQGVPCYITIQDRDFTIIKTNRSFEKDFGRAIGRKCFETYKGRASKCETCPVEKTFDDGEIHFSEETVRAKSGEAMDMIVYAAPVRDLSGRIFAVMEMSANISTVKRLQRELAILGQAVAVTAHSIKNILNGLQGGAYVVQSGLRRGDQLLARRGWEMVKESVDLVGEFVKDILLISKQRVPQYEDVMANDLARQVWNLFEKRFRDLGIEFVLEPDTGSHEAISLDPKGIHTVLTNLVANALDACLEDKGKPSHRVVLRVSDQGSDGVFFEVQDDGGGIPSSVRERLFKEMVSSKGSRGTGLGLLVTHKIVEEHMGSLSLRSEKDEGTTVRVSLPRGHLTSSSLVQGTHQSPRGLDISRAGLRDAPAFRMAQPEG